MHVEQDVVVKLAFTLKDSKGEVLDEATEKDPMVYLHGHGALPAGLEKALAGMAGAQKKDVHLTPEDGFGARDEAKIQKVGRHRLGAKSRFKQGDMLQLDTDEGAKQAQVVAVTPVTVTLDFNHPLAGMALDVSLHVLDIRAANDEEKKHGHAHGWDGKPHNHGGDHGGHDHDHDHNGHHPSHDHAGHDHAHDHQGHHPSHDHGGHDHAHDHKGHHPSHDHKK